MPAPSVIRSTALVLCAALSFLPSFVQAQESSPKSANLKPYRPGGLKPREEKELIYVALPGTLEGSWDQNGSGIVVLDATDNFNFVKRIEPWHIPASEYPEQVAGVTASPVTQMIYVATRGRLAALDLTTEKVVWENEYDGNCCERPQIASDGSFLYVGSDLKDYWYVVNPMTGELITKVVSPQSPNAHNLNLSPDDSLAFMAPNGPVMGIADTKTHTLLRTITFPDNVRVFAVNHDGSLIYSNTNNLLGFVIADVASGEIIHMVEVEGFPWRELWNARPRPVRVPHNCPSHGIALTPGEKEVWLCDGIHNYIHIFDNTVMPPKQIESIKTSAGPFWIHVGLDGNLAYVSSGDVIDMKTRQIVGHLKDEYGRPMYSEKMLDMVFTNGKLTRAANQFGNGIPEAAVAVASAADK